MLVYKNKEFRNLQEQVFKNQSDIAALKSSGIVLDEFGIKVVGQESSVANMPTVADYKELNPDWAYGDAYAIGTEPPYDLYILTREDVNHVDDYWFNIGEFPAPGPQGEQGETGETGPQGPTGPSGADGLSAGFGTISASATTLEPGEDATVSVTTSGPDTAMNISFTFGIPEGQPGEDAGAVWGNITGDIDDQTDLVNALQTKQNTLISGTNIKTINNNSILGSGNINITSSAAWGSITGTLSSQTDLKDALDAKQDVIDNNNKLSASYVSGLATVATSGSYTDLTDKPSIPTKVSDLTNDSGYITSSALSGYATETWVGQQGYLTSVSWSDVSDKPTFATVATTGDYDDLLNKPTIPTDTSDLTNSAGFITGSEVVENQANTVIVVDATHNISGKSLSAYTAVETTIGGYPVIQIKKNSAVLSEADAITYMAAQTGSDFLPVYDYDNPTYTYFIFANGKIYKPQFDSTNGLVLYYMNQLAYKADIPTATSQLTNDSGFITSSALGSYAELDGGTSDSRQEFTGYNKFNHPLIVTSNLRVVSTNGTYTTYYYPAKITCNRGGSDYDLTFPSSAGTLALTSDIPDITHMVTDNTTQTITGNKTFSGIVRFGIIQPNTSGYGLLLPDTTSYTDDKTIATTDDIPDTSNMVTTNTAQTISGAKTFSSGIVLTSGASQISDGSHYFTLPSVNGQLVVSSDVPSVSGTNDGTNWTSITIDNDTYAIPAGGGSSTDVQINGTSITSLGVANIVTNSAYNASTNKIATMSDLPSVPVTDVEVDNVSIVSSGVAELTSETWTFTLSDGTTTTKKILVG